MDRLGMVVDISHLSAPGVEHLRTVVAGSFVATHSSCAALRDHPRNLTDDQIRAVIASGGFVGINAFAPFIGTGKPTVDHFIDHLAHVATVGGPGAEGAVALGTDFIRELFRLVDPVLGRQLLVHLDDIVYIDGFEAPADFAAFGVRLVERLGEPRARRFAADNMLDFFRRRLPPGAP